MAKRVRRKESRKVEGSDRQKDPKAVIAFETGFNSSIGLLALLLLLPKRASAYTDPGAGALLWQTLVAGFTGLAFYFCRFLIRLFHLWKRDRKI